MSKTLHSQGQETLIAALVAARKASGLTQTDLAVRLRCHQSLIARIESGQRRIDEPGDRHARQVGIVEQAVDPGPGRLHEGEVRQARGGPRSCRPRGQHRQTCRVHSALPVHEAPASKVANTYTLPLA